MVRRRITVLTVVVFTLLVAVLAAPTTSSAALTYTYLTQWGGVGTADGDLNVPWSVSVDNQGLVYTTEFMVPPVQRGQRFTGNGVHQLTYGSKGTGNGQFDIPTDTAIAPNGDIYVTDETGDRIVVFNKNGTFLRNLGSSGDGEGELNSPGGVAIGKFGHVYIADTGNDRIQVLDSAGNFIREWGENGTGNGQFDQPKGIALDLLGNVYVCEGNNDRVQKFDSQGTYITQWGSHGTGDSQFDVPDDVSCDPWGRVYVVEFNNERVQVFDSTGTHLATFGSHGTSNGLFNLPSGVEADAYRNVFVADVWNNRVQKFAAPQPTYVWAGAGKTRIQTAITVAEYGWPLELLEDADGSKSAILATARNWPDALAAGALAGAVQGPILLAEPDSLPTDVAAELGRLGADRIFIVGGPSAISEDVATAVDELPGVTQVTRLGGATRYETAEIIANEVKRILGEDFEGEAIVATGENFPDALAGAPISYARCWPILLARQDGLPQGLEGVDQAVILGGDAAVSAEVAADLAGSLGEGNVERVAGANRYLTAIETARWGVANAGLTWSHTAVSTGENWPDALAGGPLQGRFGSVMLLTPTDTARADVVKTVKDMRRGIGELRFIGGPAAVSDDVRDALVAVTIDPQ